MFLKNSLRINNANGAMGRVSQASVLPDLDPADGPASELALSAVTPPCVAGRNVAGGSRVIAQISSGYLAGP